MDGYKHYVRVDANGIVIHGFSDAFEQPQTGDLPLNGDFGRHFQIELHDQEGQFKYKIVNGQMVERTTAEIQAAPEYKQKRREDVMSKWDPQIDAQRELLRRLQDEDKPAAAITKAKTNLHNLVASKNTELMGVK